MRDNIPSNFADTPYCYHATNLCHHFLISVFQLATPFPCFLVWYYYWQ